MKHTIAKELLYLLVALVVAVPVALLFLALVDTTSPTQPLSPDEQVLEMDLLIIGALLGFIGVYLVRAIMWAVKQLIGQ